MMNAVKKTVARTNPDTKVYGPEPTKATVRSSDKVSVIIALNWYSHFYTPKEGAPWVVEYMKRNGYTPEQVQLFQKSESTMFVCGVARMLNNGVKLPGDLVKSFKDKLSKLTRPVLVASSVAPKKVELRKENHILADLDDCLDQFFLSGYKTGPVVEDYKLTSKVTKADLASALTYYKQLLVEVSTFKEGYERLRPREKKAYVGYLGRLVTHLEALQGDSKSIPKKPRKPRKKKVKSALELTKKVQFEVTNRDLKVSSVKPESIVGATVVWLYNTRYKKLTRLEAETPGGLSVKGTTVIGFGKESVCKRLRKPGQVVPALVKAGKREENKLWKTLKTKPVVVNGRMNKNTLILKVHK